MRVRPFLLLPSVLAASCAVLSSPRPGALAPSFAVGPVELVGEGTLSTPANEYNPSLAPDGRTLYFARSAPGFRDARIMVSRRVDGRWGAPERIGFSDDRYTDSDPTLSPDGRTLYFISDRPAAGREAGRRDLDLWKAERTGEGWGAPVHLGPEVNSPGQELGPTFRDGYLYFGSTRSGGRGKIDLYRSRWTGSAFAAPESLGDPVDSPDSESDPELSRDGEAVLFWSDRASAAGGGDLYLARRTAGGWSAPARLSGAVNSAGFDFTPSFSPDGKWLYFASTRGDTARAGAEGRVLNGRSNLYRVRIGR